MKIAFNLWTLKEKKRREGIGWFVTHILNIYLEKYQEVEFVFFTTRDFDEGEFARPNVKIYKIFPNKRHPVLYVSFLHYLLPLYLRKLKPDLIVCPDGMSSLNTNTPQLPIIHDIHFFHLPKDAKWYNRWYYNRYFPRYAKKAVRVATVSEYSKEDIAVSYQIPASKIDVVYCGLNDHFLHPQPKPVPFRFEYILTGKPYFIFIGSLNPRKNIPRLIEAFSLFRAKGIDARLVIAGAKGWLTDAIDAAFAASKYKEDIIFTGRLADDEVMPLLKGALAMSFVPYYEGFGIPLIEAMSCSTPIITSKVTSLPEIAGAAALYVDPKEVAQIANALQQIAANEELRNRLIAVGNARWPQFSWENTADLLWQSIHYAIAESGSSKRKSSA